MNKEEIRKTAWESVGDEKLFPNHSDKDIWNNGFDACYNILSTTSQTHKAMSAEEFLINQGYTKIVTYPNKEVVEITFRWETVIRLLNEYTSQFQPLPVGGKSVDNCFDEIGNKINTLQDVNLKNRLHAAKDLLKLHLQSSLPVQQPVSDGVEKGEWFSMDEHAQIMAIDFANWLLENVYSVNGCWYLNEGMSGEIYTTEHLYTIFKNRNQSSKK